MVLQEYVWKKILYHCLTVLRRSDVRARRPLSQPRPIAFLLCHHRFLYVCSPKGHWLGAWVSRPRQTSRARCPKTDDKKNTHSYGLAVLRRPFVRARRPLSQPRLIVSFCVITGLYPYAARRTLAGGVGVPPAPDVEGSMPEDG